MQFADHGTFDTLVRCDVNTGEEVMFENIVWSEQPCTLKTFIDSYLLPQLVKVEDGYYSAKDAETLSKDDILTLHFTKRTDKLHIEATDHKRYFIPLNCPCKIEILPRICEDRYYSVEDVVDAWTSDDFKFIRVVHNGPPQLRIRAGDILKLRKTVEEKRVKFLECEFHDKTKDSVRLPLDFKAAFEPLARAEQCHLQEVVTKLPLRVKFTSCDTTIQGANDINVVDLPSLGSVLLKEFREEITVIATSRHDNLVTVLMIPADLDVNVLPAHGAIIGDKKYARFCREIHDGTELTKVDFSKQGSMMMFEESTVNVIYDYAEVKPLLPRRNRLHSTDQSDNSDSSDDYEDVNKPAIPRRQTSKPAMTQSKAREEIEPPPRPPKPRTLSMNLKPVPAYENMHAGSEITAPIEKPFGSCEASPRYFNEGSDDNVDDEDENPYVSSDEDYIYPEIDEPECNTSNHGNPESPKEQLGPSEGHKKTMKEKVFGKFKAIAKSPPFRSSNIPRSLQGPCPTPSPPPVPISPRTTSRAATGRDLPQSFPDDLRNLSVSKVSECLRLLNMGEHVETFESEQIDGELFVTLNEDTLPYLGVSNKFQQRKLLKFIQGWRPEGNDKL